LKNIINYITLKTVPDLPKCRLLEDLGDCYIIAIMTMISIFFISMSSINTMYFHQGAAEGFLTSKDKFLKPTDLIPVPFAVSGKYTNSTDFHEIMILNLRL
jgi:hypothetical protein